MSKAIINFGAGIVRIIGFNSWSWRPGIPCTGHRLQGNFSSAKWSCGTLSEWSPSGDWQVNGWCILVTGRAELHFYRPDFWVWMWLEAFFLPSILFQESYVSVEDFKGFCLATTFVFCRYKCSCCYFISLRAFSIVSPSAIRINYPWPGSHFVQVQPFSAGPFLH